MTLSAVSRVWQFSKASGDHLVVMHLLANNADDQGIVEVPLSSQFHKDARLEKMELANVLCELVASGELLIDRKRNCFRLKPEWFELPAQQSKITQHRRIKAREGYVYILRATPDHPYKIGHTTNPRNRIETFGVKLPFEVEYELLIRADDCVELERSLHARFADKRVNGEWFALTQDDIEALRQEWEIHNVLTD